MASTAQVFAGRDDVSLVPILVGDMAGGQRAEYAALLAPHLADPACLFVISSDFCHWGARFGYQYIHPACKGCAIHEAIEHLDREVSWRMGGHPAAAAIYCRLCVYLLNSLLFLIQGHGTGRGHGSHRLQHISAQAQEHHMRPKPHPAAVGGACDPPHFFSFAHTLLMQRHGRYHRQYRSWRQKRAGAGLSLCTTPSRVPARYPPTARSAMPRLLLRPRHNSVRSTYIGAGLYCVVFTTELTWRHSTVQCSPSCKYIVAGISGPLAKHTPHTATCMWPRGTSARE